MNSITYSLNHEGSYIYFFKKVIFGGRKSVLDMSSWLDRIISYSSFLRKPQKFPHTWRKMNSFRVPGVGLVGKGEVMFLKLCSISILHLTSSRKAEGKIIYFTITKEIVFISNF